MLDGAQEAVTPAGVDAVVRETAPPKPPLDCNDFDVCAQATYDASINPFGHLRGILGFAFDPRIAGFVAAGAAFAHASGEAVATTKAFGPIVVVGAERLPSEHAASVRGVR